MRRQLYLGPTTLPQLGTFAHHMASALMKKAAPPADNTVELEVSDTALCRLLSSITSAHSDPPMTALYVKKKKKKKTPKLILIWSLLGIHVCIMCLRPSMWKVQSDEMTKLGWDNTMLSSAYPIHGSASEVNRSDADTQVVSCHCYLVVFHLFVEQLTVFYISGVIL